MRLMELSSQYHMTVISWIELFEEFLLLKMVISANMRGIIRIIFWQDQKRPGKQKELGENRKKKRQKK